MIYEVFSFQIEQQFLDCRVYWKISGCLEIGHSFLLVAFLWGLDKRQRRWATRISILIGIAPINHMKIQGYKKSNAKPCYSFCPLAMLFRQYDLGQDWASATFFGILRSYHLHLGCGVCTGETTLSFSHFISVLHELSFCPKCELAKHLT